MFSAKVGIIFSESATITFIGLYFPEIVHRRKRKQHVQMQTQRCMTSNFFYNFGAHGFWFKPGAARRGCQYAVNGGINPQLEYRQAGYTVVMQTIRLQANEFKSAVCLVSACLKTVIHVLKLQKA